MSKKTKAKPFKNWLYEEVAQEFGLHRVEEHPFLSQLNECTLSESHPLREQIEDLRSSLRTYAEAWNEDELKTMFINPFVRLARFISPYYKVFTQRPMSVRYNNDTQLTEGLVEYMLAKGFQIPTKPHFFIHEYKPEKRRDNDPLGQLLIAMIACQQKNQDNKPLYGLYVAGRLWFFVVLDGKTCAVSKSYSAEDDEIFKIFAMLLHIKDVIEKLYREI